jgi:glycosyltransferase involved in cell wall biosynthesis
MGRTAVLPSSYPGQIASLELEQLAAAGERPRKDHVELARTLEADVIDSEYLARQARRLPRRLAASRRLAAAQVAEAFSRRGEFTNICATADKLGLPLALLLKLSLARTRLVLVSDWLSRREKSVFLQYLRVHSHLAAIISPSSVQLEIAAKRFGVPETRLHHLPTPVDERFWSPGDDPVEDIMCSVGLEARDYPTLIQAVRGLDLEVHIALGTPWLSPSGLIRAGANGHHGGVDFRLLKGTYSHDLVSSFLASISRDGLPSNVKLVWPDLKGLRQLYSRARFVVIPLRDVEFAAGGTSLTEAMAMGKAVVLTRTRGQVDIVRDGEDGIYVPPSDPVALRGAIEYLAGHPSVAERMGRAGRASIERRHSLDAWVARVADLVTGEASR